MAIRLHSLIILFIAEMIIGVTSGFSSEVENLCEGNETNILVENTCTKIQTFKSTSLKNRPILLLALHGDSYPGFKTIDHYRFASEIAEQTENIVAVGITRPGYRDEFDRVSDGIEGEGIGDNYDRSRVDQVANVIRELKGHYMPSRVIIVGQSGGAALSANLLSFHPDIANQAFLIACPCDVQTWRHDMFLRTQKSVFEKNLYFSSPIDNVERVSDDVSITLFSGTDDQVATPSLIKRYEVALHRADKKVELHMIKGNHELFLNQDVLKVIIKTIDRDQAIAINS